MKEATLSFPLLIRFMYYSHTSVSYSATAAGDSHHRKALRIDHLADHAAVLIVGDGLATGGFREVNSFQHLLGTRTQEAIPPAAVCPDSKLVHSFKINLFGKPSVSFRTNLNFYNS